MTRIIFILLAVVSTFFQLQAQSSLGINYQAVVRGIDGAPLANQEVSFRFKYAPNGDTTNVAYTETFIQTTNEFGLANLVLTFGTPVSGTVDALDFAAVDYWIVTELDIDGGTNYEVMGIAPFEKVPYAEVANTARNVDDADADPANELQQLSVNGDQLSLSQGGGSVTLPPSEDADADPTNELELPANPNAGDLAYYNGTTQEWEAVAAGRGGQLLTLSNNGTPRWSGLTTEDLLEIELPNGELRWVHPTDNSAAINWNPQGINSSFSPPISEVQFTSALSDYNGAINTPIITNFYAESTIEIAAKLCDDLVAFGFDDWYLPAIGELFQMYEQLGPNGSNQIISGRYYSSTTGGLGGNIVGIFDFQIGEILPTPPNDQMRCRCMRD